MSAESTEYFSQTRSELLPLVPDQISRTLDVGCGGGVFSEALKRVRNIEARSIEMSNVAAGVATTRLRPTWMPS